MPRMQLLPEYRHRLSGETVKCRNYVSGHKLNETIFQRIEKWPYQTTYPYSSGNNSPCLKAFVVIDADSQTIGKMISKKQTNASKIVLGHIIFYFRITLLVAKVKSNLMVNKFLYNMPINKFGNCVIIQYFLLFLIGDDPYYGFIMKKGAH